MCVCDNYVYTELQHVNYLCNPSACDCDNYIMYCLLLHYSRKFFQNYSPIHKVTPLLLMWNLLNALSNI